MPTIVIQAKNYKNREDLEAAIVLVLGRSAEKKDCIIKGKKGEMSNLHLDDRNLVWGCSCEITDEPTKNRENLRIPRGEQFKSGINLDI